MMIWWILFIIVVIDDLDIVECIKEIVLYVIFDNWIEVNIGWLKFIKVLRDNKRNIVK